jgi:hypothetical protein
LIRQSPAALFLRLLGFVRLLNDERFYTRSFLLEPVHEVVRAVLEEDDEAKGKENKKYEPKESAYQRHDRHDNLAKLAGQRFVTSHKLRIEPGNETAMLFGPCACRCSI